MPGNEPKAAELCEELPWDSRLFGVSIARAIPSHADARTCQAMLDWCDDHDIDCLYFLASGSDASSAAELERAGFRAVGVRVTLRRQLDAGTSPPPPERAIRTASPEDIPRLREIASTSHRDTRFYSDGHFDSHRCDQLYATWIENSVNGYATCVLVAERADAVVGYATLHLEPAASPGGSPARIGLVAVDSHWRNQGIGRDLVRGVVHRGAVTGADSISVVASEGNVAAVTLYEREGFRTAHRAIWYHRWFGAEV